MDSVASLLWLESYVFKIMKTPYLYSSVLLKSFIDTLGAHNACRYLKTDCQASERCVPRWVSGQVSPGQYKCVCKSKGFKEIRGQGCFGKMYLSYFSGHSFEGTKNKIMPRKNWVLRYNCNL